MTFSLIMRFNQRLGGYSIWSASTSRTIYKQEFRAWAPHSLGATRRTWKTTRCTRRKAQKQPKGCSDYLKYSKTPRQVLDACRTRLRRARGLVRPGGSGIYVSEIYFSNFLKNKEEEEKDWSDPQLDSTIQPKVRGPLHMEREYFAHHIWSRFRGLSTS